MQSIAPEAVEHPYISTWKVHRLSCLELKKIMDRITEIFTSVESARPRCKPGLQALCLLHLSMEECTLLLRHCSESSKLYLAISGEKIILRCKKIRLSLESCLSQLKNNVEPTLAAQISRIINYIKTVTFTLDSSEDEAGKVLLALLYQDIAASGSNVDEIKAFRLAAFRLQITSPLAVLIEKRSIRRLLSKIRDTNPAKRKILNYFLYLMRKYGKSIQTPKFEKVTNETSAEPEGDEDAFDSLEPPVKFESHRLNKLSFSCSESSFGSSLGGLRLQVDNVSFRSSDTNTSDYVSDGETEDGFGQIQENFRRFKCSPSEENGTNLFILAILSSLPWPSRRKAVEDARNDLKDNQGFRFTVSTSYIKPVFKFTKEAHRLGDSGAKRHGVELLLMLLKDCRTEVPPLPKDAMYDLLLFLDSKTTEEALPILEVLSLQQHYTSEIVASFILKILKNPKSKHQTPALRVLINLSAHTHLAHHLIYLECIRLLVPFLDDLLLSGYCLKIFRNFCTIEESTAHFVENENCIVSIGELLEVGKEEEQENALNILLALAYQREELHKVLMQDSIVSSLVIISQNGSDKGKAISVELLHLLNSVTDDRSQECGVSNIGQNPDGNLRPKSLGFFGRIKSRFRKPVFFS